MRAARIALPLVGLGAVLRLRDLGAMEFKADEHNALDLGMRLLDAHPWSSAQPFPSHGLISSNNVANAPLFTWIVAAAWSSTHDPVAVARLIAMVNALCLYPLWRWARQRMDEGRALLTLAVCAVSPFAVLFSRKIWTQDLLLPGVVAALWGIEWLRSERRWRGVLLLAVSALVMGQLHQSGAIALALLPLALAGQHVVDRRNGWKPPRPSPPTVVEIAVLAVVVAANLFFWLPYVGYLASVPADVIANRPKLDVMTLQLLRRIAGQVRPIDLFYFFDPDRADFLRGPFRAAFYYGSVALGTPLVVYGIWRWLRAPFALPVVGIWWWSIVALFTVAKIPSYPFYVLALAPLPALVAAGAFDGDLLRRWIERAAAGWRIAYVASLLGLTIATQSWISSRGGSTGDYGITYRVVDAQARAVEAASPDTVPLVRLGDGSLLPPDDSLPCHSPSDEVQWIARHVHRQPIERPSLVCDRWTTTGDGLVYSWEVRRGGVRPAQ